MVPWAARHRSSALTALRAGEIPRAGTCTGPAAVAITPGEIEREKNALPFGCGRFGEALDRLGELSRPTSRNAPPIMAR